MKESNKQRIAIFILIISFCYISYFIYDNLLSIPEIVKIEANDRCNQGGAGNYQKIIPSLIAYDDKREFYIYCEIRDTYYSEYLGKVKSIGEDFIIGVKK